MKTTNNKLLDNTGNPVSHNRPQPYQGVPLEQYLEIVAIKDKLERENQELKEKLETKTHFLTLEEKRVSNLMKLVNEQQDKFLKVVESVLRTHKETETIVNETKDTITYDAVCACGFKEYSSHQYRQHLLQEIKSAMEKGKE